MSNLISQTGPADSAPPYEPHVVDRFVELMTTEIERVEALGRDQLAELDRSAALIRRRVSGEVAQIRHMVAQVKERTEPAPPLNEFAPEDRRGYPPVEGSPSGAFRLPPYAQQPQPQPQQQGQVLA